MTLLPSANTTCILRSVCRYEHDHLSAWPPSESLFSSSGTVSSTKLLSESLSFCQALGGRGGVGGGGYRTAKYAVGFVGLFHMS